jgi:hypothetical protein
VLRSGEKSTPQGGAPATLPVMPPPSPSRPQLRPGAIVMSLISVGLLIVTLGAVPSAVGAARPQGGPAGRAPSASVAVINTLEGVNGGHFQGHFRVESLTGGQPHDLARVADGRLVGAGGGWAVIETFDGLAEAVQTDSGQVVKLPGLDPRKQSEPVGMVDPTGSEIAVVQTGPDGTPEIAIATLASGAGRVVPAPKTSQFLWSWSPQGITVKTSAGAVLVDPVTGAASPYPTVPERLSIQGVFPASGAAAMAVTAYESGIAVPALRGATSPANVLYVLDHGDPTPHLLRQAPGRNLVVLAMDADGTVLVQNFPQVAASASTAPPPSDLELVHHDGRIEQLTPFSTSVGYTAVTPAGPGQVLAVSFPIPPDGKLTHQETIPMTVEILQAGAPPRTIDTIVGLTRTEMLMAA